MNFAAYSDAEPGLRVEMFHPGSDDPTIVAEERDWHTTFAVYRPVRNRYGRVTGVRYERATLSDALRLARKPIPK